MELRIIEYTGGEAYVRRRNIFLFILLLIMQVCTFTVREHYWIAYLGFGGIILAWMWIFYRRFNAAGMLGLKEDSVTVSGNSEAVPISLHELACVKLEYTNCWKAAGKFCNITPNFITLVPKEGPTRKYQVLINGKKAKKQLKAVLESYRLKGVGIDVVSRVSSTWQEF